MKKLLKYIAGIIFVQVLLLIPVIDVFFVGWLMRKYAEHIVNEAKENE